MSGVMPAVFTVQRHFAHLCAIDTIINQPTVEGRSAKTVGARRGAVGVQWATWEGLCLAEWGYETLPADRRQGIAQSRHALHGSQSPTPGIFNYERT